MCIHISIYMSTGVYKCIYGYALSCKRRLRIRSGGPIAIQFSNIANNSFGILKEDEFFVRIPSKYIYLAAKIDINRDVASINFHISSQIYKYTDTHTHTQLICSAIHLSYY